MEKKKILTIVFALTKGGTERAAQNFAEAYHEIGHDSRLLSLYKLGPRYDELKNKIKVYHQASNATLENIKEWSPNIIHIHSHCLDEKDVTNIFNTLNNTNLKIIEQNVFSIPSPWSDKIDISFQLSRWALWLYNLRGGCKYNSAITPYPIKCKNFYHQNNEKINEFKLKYNIPENAFIVGRIGQASPGKWSTMLIDCFNILNKKHKNIYLIIVNPPDNITRKVNKSVFKNKIICIPKILGDENLATVYSSFDLMLHIAEQGESFGYVLVESMSCETPVVTLSTPWGDNTQCEVVQNLKGGYVVNSQKGIIAAIENYINLTKKEKQKLKISAKQQAQQYDYVKIARQAITIINQKEKSKISVKSIIKLIKIAFDKPKYLTILLLKLNSNFFRKKIIYLNLPIKVLFSKIKYKFKALWIITK